MQKAAKHTPGAIRAAKLITAKFGVHRDMQARCARIIDRETAAPYLLAACEQMMHVLGSDADDPAFDWVHAAIARAKGGAA